MALPSSPPITMQQIYAEFGAPNGTPLSSFVRGGAYVPNTAQNAGVPTALPISMLQLLGASKQTVVVSNKDVTQSRWRETNDFPPPAYIQQGSEGYIIFNTDGTLQWSHTINGDFESGTGNPGAVTNYPGEWLPSGNPSDYEVAIIDNGRGNFSSIGFTLGTYYGLGTRRVLGFTCSYANSTGSVGNFLIRIRGAGGGAQVVEATLRITAIST